MDNKNSPIFYYDEEKARTSKSPILIALTELQQAVLYDIIVHKLKVNEKTWLIMNGRFLTVYHPSIVEKQENHKFTHYVYALNDKYVNVLLQSISKYKWNTEDVLEWQDDYLMVYNKQHMSSHSLQQLINEVVDDYVRAHGDPRSKLNKKLVTEVTKQKMMSAKHCGRIPADE